MPVSTTLVARLLDEEIKLACCKQGCVHLFIHTWHTKQHIPSLIKSSFDMGYYVNADDLEREIRKTGILPINQFGFNSQNLAAFDSFVRHHNLSQKAKERGLTIDIKADNNVLLIRKGHQLSYAAALIAEFIRQELIKNGNKLTFETVMSHQSKINILKNSDKSWL